ncbi:MAG TPA: hypothetical protein VIC05_02485 [Solirubrobacteraceae bacterium]
MGRDQLSQQIKLLELVASEAVEEPDAIARHPDVVDLVEGLADYDGLSELFGSNGHDPAAFARALAEGLVPYRTQPLTDAPELVEGLAILAAALRGKYAAGEGVPLPV